MSALDPLILLGGFGPILFGIALLATVRLLRPHGAIESGDPIHMVLGITAWTMIPIGILALVIGLFGFVVGAIGLVIGAMILNRRRRVEQDALLATLQAAATRWMPLATALEAYAGDRRDAIARRARHAASLLRAGHALPDALRQTPFLLPAETLLMIQVGHQAGALAPALEQSIGIASLYRTLWNQVITRLTYLAYMLLFAVAVGTFMMVRIVPAFQKIFADFNAELPGITQAVIALADFAANTGILFLGMLVVTPLFFYLVLRYIGWVRWDLPGMGFLTRPHDSATILDALSLVAQQGRPLPAALELMAAQYPKHSIRWRLAKVVAEVQAGGEWTRSLAAHRLATSAQAAVLESAQRASNLAWALREMADSSRRRLAYRAQIWIQILFPLVLLAYAALTGLFAVGFLMPLASLIRKLV